jgi:hypothetical protein
VQLQEKEFGLCEILPASCGAGGQKEVIYSLNVPFSAKYQTPLLNGEFSLNGESLPLLTGQESERNFQPTFSFLTQPFFILHTCRPHTIPLPPSLPFASRLLYTHL